MCGIAGFISRSVRQRKPVEVTREIISRLRHRGPDGEGLWTSDDGSTALGHARLSILDLSSAGAQPMATEDERFVISFNGEVFNFLELSRELDGLGHRFHTSTDTEVVLAAYRQWGIDAFARFNGMWALAIYDTYEKTLTLSRDRFGIKPLYYFRDSGVFAFASEIMALHGALDQRLSEDWEFLNSLMDYDVSVFGGTRTSFTGVVSLEPGCVAQVQDCELTHRRWYTLEKISVPSTYEEQRECFRDLFDDACRLRLRSDVPVATCLSGGIDSGSIVSTLARFSQPESERFCQFSHRAFTAGFPNSANDETHAARQLASECGVSFNLKTMECPAVEELEAAVAACDGPMPAMSFFPIWKLYQFIREQGIAVTLDGQAADEMLGGYYLGYPAVRGAMELGSRRYVNDIRETYSALHSNAANWFASAEALARQDMRSVFRQRLKRPIKKLLSIIGLHKLQPDRLRQPPAVPAAVGSSLREQADWLHNVLWQQFFVSPLPFLLHQYDRCSMASSVECRMPFMDYRLVEFVYSLPIASRIGKGFTKRILRDAMKGRLPEEIRTNRIKTGFNAPFGDWMRGGVREWVMDTMDTECFRTLPGQAVAELRKTFERGNLDSAGERVLWSKLHVANWLDRSRSRQKLSI